MSETPASIKAVTWAERLASWDLEHKAMPSTKHIMRDIDPAFGHDAIAAHMQYVKKTATEEYFLKIKPNRLDILCSKYFYIAIEKLRAVGC